MNNLQVAAKVILVLEEAMQDVGLSSTGNAKILPKANDLFDVTFIYKDVTFSFPLRMYRDGADMLRIRIAVDEAVIKNFNMLKGGE